MDVEADGGNERMCETEYVCEWISREKHVHLFILRIKKSFAPLAVSSHTHACSTSYVIRSLYMCVFDPGHPKHSLLFCCNIDGKAMCSYFYFARDSWKE